LSRPRKKPEEMSFPELILFASKMEKRLNAIDKIISKVMIPTLESIEKVSSSNSKAIDKLWIKEFGSVVRKPGEM